MKKYGLKWIWKQTKGTRGYLLLLSLAVIAMGVVNMGMTTVLMNLVNIAAGNLKQSIGKNVVWAIFFLGLEGIMGLTTMVAYRMAVNQTGKRMRGELEHRVSLASLLALQKKHVGE